MPEKERYRMHILTWLALSSTLSYVTSDLAHYYDCRNVWLIGVLIVGVGTALLLAFDRIRP